jgi:hypothetical protein
MKRIKVVGKTLDLQILFCSFLVQDSSKEAMKLAKRGPKFPWGPMLEAFTVIMKSQNVSQKFGILTDLAL